MRIEKEDFEQWLSHPVTEEVMRALRILADKAKETWVSKSWDGGNVDPVLLADLKSVSRIAGDLSELTFEELEECLNEQPERNQSNGIQSIGAAKAH